MKSKMIAISGFGRGWWFKSISSKMHPCVSFWIDFSARKIPREESVKGWYKLRIGENMNDVRGFVISDNICIIVSNAIKAYTSYQDKELMNNGLWWHISLLS